VESNVTPIKLRGHENVYIGKYNASFYDGFGPIQDFVDGFSSENTSKGGL